MKIEMCFIPGLKLITPDIYKDARGIFFETWQFKKYYDNGIQDYFLQDSVSLSIKNVRRGLHYQYPHSQAKLVSVLKGEIFDVVVDIRCTSPTFGNWFGIILNDIIFNQLYIPKGFAHGYNVLSNEAIISYKLSDYYNPSDEKGISCDDPDIKIKWKKSKNSQFIMNARDAQFPLLKNIPNNQLFNEF
jgi:dTDP-4-dehydrorhamnose 3,5-epimerase